MGPWESRPEEGVISYDSDLGRKILGKRVGEAVEIDGADWRVGRIESSS